MDWSASLTNIPRTDLAATFGVAEAMKPVPISPTFGAKPAIAVGTWKALAIHALNDEIVDSNNNIQSCSTAGTSGTAMPTWGKDKDEKTVDGSVTWSLVGSESKVGAQSAIPAIPAKPVAAPAVKHRLVTVPPTLTDSAKAQFALASKLAVELAKGVKGNNVLVAMHGTSSDAEPQSGYAPEQLSVVVSRASA